MANDPRQHDAHDPRTDAPEHSSKSHSGKVEEVSHGFFQATCGCGWRSAELGDKSLAEASLVRHGQFPDEHYVEAGKHNPGSDQTTNNTVPLVDNKPADAAVNPDKAPMPDKK